MIQASVDNLVQAQRWFLIPCNGKQPAMQWTKLTKQPRISLGQNYGIVTGQRNDLYVVDCDLLKDEDPDTLLDGVQIMQVIVATFADREYWKVPIVRTGGGGMHFYFKYSGSKFTKQGTNMIRVVKKYSDGEVKYRAKIDARSDNGYTIGPGSVHPVTGKLYKWTETRSLEEYKPLPLPKVLEQLLSGEYYIELIMGENEKVLMVDLMKSKTVIKTKDLVMDGHDDAAKVENLEEIVMGLDPSRADRYDDWLKVVWAIHSVSGGKALDLADKFSQQSSKKYVGREDVEAKFITSNGSIRMGSLWYWLKEDNPELFNKLYTQHRETVSKLQEFCNYRELAAKAVAEKLTLNELIAFFKSVIVRITNGGRSFWMTKNYDADGRLNYVMNERNPFAGDNDVDFVIGEVKSSFSKVLKKYGNLPDFPSADAINFLPFLEEKDITYNKKKVFNTFPGFPFKRRADWKESEITKISRILWHMEHVLCNGSAEVFSYYLNYLAHMIQKPYEKPEVCIVFSSVQGTGKSICHDFVGSLVGDSLCYTMAEATDMTGSFNKQLENKLFVVANECRCFDETLNMEKLKSLITDRTMKIEPKHVDAYNVNNPLRMIFHTNSTYPLPLSVGDRRFLIVRIDSERLQNRAYYDVLIKDMQNPDCAETFFQFLASRDIRDYNPRIIPETNAKKELKVMSLHSSARFIRDIILGDFELHDFFTKKDGTKVIATADLYAAFERWCVKSGERSKCSLKTLKQKLDEIGIVEEEKRVKHCNSQVKVYKWKKVEERMASLISEEKNKPSGDQPDDL